MFKRLLKILASLKTKERIQDTSISTTVDDTLEGKRVSFDPERVQELLIRCKLLESMEEKPPSVGASRSESNPYD